MAKPLLFKKAKIQNLPVYDCPYNSKQCLYRYLKCRDGQIMCKKCELEKIEYPLENKILIKQYI